MTILLVYYHYPHIPPTHTSGRLAFSHTVVIAFRSVLMSPEIWSVIWSVRKSLTSGDSFQHLSRSGAHMTNIILHSKEIGWNRNLVGTHWEFHGGNLFTYRYVPMKFHLRNTNNVQAIIRQLRARRGLLQSEDVQLRTRRARLP